MKVLMCQQAIKSGDLNMTDCIGRLVLCATGTCDSAKAANAALIYNNS